MGLCLMLCEVCVCVCVWGGGGGCMEWDLLRTLCTYKTSVVWNKPFTGSEHDLQCKCIVDTL